MLLKILNFNNYNHKSKLVHINYLGTYRTSYLLLSIFIRQCSTTSVISNHKFLTSNDLRILKTLCKIKIKKGKIVNISTLLQDVTLLKISYKLLVLKLRSKNFLNSIEVFKKNIQNIWFENLSNKLKTGNFKYIVIKKNRNFKFTNFKLLKLSNLRNNIVTQALELILEIIYEPIFLSTSHGFRPLKGCHSALKHIKLFWNDISWINVYKFKFKQIINYNRLIKIMCTRINDKSFFTLLKSFFKKNTFTLNFKKINLLRPILINIYLHNLDVELEKLKKKYKLFFKFFFYKYYNFNLLLLRKTSFRILTLIKYGKLLTHKTLNYCQYKTELKNQKLQLRPFKIRYIRYLNFFLLGVTNNYRNNYQKINKHLLTYCNSNLKLLLAYKSPVKVSSTTTVNFLNFEISYTQLKNFCIHSKKSLESQLWRKKQLILKRVTFSILKQKKILLTKFSNLFFNYNKKKQFKKKVDNFKFLNMNKKINSIKLLNSKKKNFFFISLKAPLLWIQNNFVSNDIITTSNKTKTITWLIPYSNFLIVKWFKNKSKNLLNTYCCCQNFNKIKIFVDRILRYCALKTLATKNKLTIQKTLKIWSKNMIIKDKTKKFILIQFLTKSEIQNQKNLFLTDLNFINFD